MSPWQLFTPLYHLIVYRWTRGKGREQRTPNNKTSTKKLLLVPNTSSIQQRAGQGHRLQESHPLELGQRFSGRNAHLEGGFSVPESRGRAQLPGWLFCMKCKLIHSTSKEAVISWNDAKAMHTSSGQFSSFRCFFLRKLGEV